jgi:protein-S-isoprenylcysteine O-methyltransferase Ste14
MFQRIAVFAYGLASYAIFFCTFLYAAGFVGGFVVPTTLDGAPRSPLWQALLIDVLLLSVFAVQHSLMARPGFKAWLTRAAPAAAERSTYVLFSSLALIALFAHWQPLGGTVWNVEDPIGRGVLYGLFAFGWLLVLVTTFLINHFDLFGLRQVWLFLTGKPYTPLRFVTPGPYRIVRHPLYVGWFFAFWATPTMSVSHLLFALATTACILIAIQLEERDLMSAHGEDYASYRRRVPMLIPRLFGRSAARAQAAQA